MNNFQEVNLAWSLIDAAKPKLDPRERRHVFVTVGAGDSFAAIRLLLKLIVAKQIPLSRELVQTCVTWLEAYVLHEDHECLRRQIADITGPAIIRIEAPVQRCPALPATRYRRPFDKLFPAVRRA